MRQPICSTYEYQARAMRVLVSLNKPASKIPKQRVASLRKQLDRALTPELLQRMCAGLRNLEGSADTVLKALLNLPGISIMTLMPPSVAALLVALIVKFGIGYFCSKSPPRG